MAVIISKCQVVEYLKQQKKSYFDDLEYVDIRLQIMPYHDQNVCAYTYQFWSGHSDFDTDTRGFWGSVSMHKSANIREVADELMQNLCNYSNAGKSEIYYRNGRIQHIPKKPERKYAR
jgi:hypothetical protein